MNETDQLLRDAAHEIRVLRRDNELLRARVEVMDLFACVLHTTPASRGQGMAPDIAWLIDQHLERPTGDKGND